VDNGYGGKMARQKTRTAQDLARQNQQRQVTFRERRKAEGFIEFKRWIKPLDKPPKEAEKAAAGLLEVLKSCYAHEWAGYEEPVRQDMSALQGLLEIIGLVSNPIE
jgi:hypothetical protein